MNINDQWPDELPRDVKRNSLVAWDYLLSLRLRSYRGFAQVEMEGNKGFLRPSADLATSLGQEMVRVLFARGMEELIEAMDAEDTDHVLEELIDSLNYFLAIPLLAAGTELGDSQVTVLGYTAQVCYDAFDSLHVETGVGIPDLNAATSGKGIPEVDVLSPGGIVGLLTSAGTMLEKLRNRGWQNSPQSLYFDGYPSIAGFIRYLIRMYCGTAFKGDWEHFAKFFIAKDKVLQFRLRSMY